MKGLYLSLLYEMDMYVQSTHHEFYLCHVTLRDWILIHTHFILQKKKEEMGKMGAL